MSGPRPEDYFAGLAELIDSLGLRWALAGALAAARYRVHARLTTDADLVVEWDPRLPGVIEADGWTVRTLADPGDPPHLIRAQRGEERVDLLVALTDYQREALRRAHDNVLSLEDVIVHKLIAGRPRDRSDIRSILEAGHAIDWDYVRHWAQEFGVWERVREFGIS